MDTGAFAALLGYDAINAEGHGASGSYTVILNRTKCIFLDDSIHEDSKDGSTITFQLGPDGIIYAIRNRKVIGWVRALDSASEKREDGGPGSGNFGHKGVPGQIGGSAPSYSSDEVSAVEYWKEGADGWGYANIKAVLNGQEPPIVRKAREAGNDSLAEERMSKLKGISENFAKAVDKAPSCEGQEAIRVTGRYGIVGIGKPEVGQEFEIPAYDPFSTASKEKQSEIIEKFGAEDQVVFRIQSPSYFKDINDIGNVSTKAEHEVMPSETRKYRITKVGTENYGGDENPDWLGGGYSGGVNVVVVDIEPSDQRTDGGPGS